MKLTPWVLVAGLIIGTLVGPLETVSTESEGFLRDQDFWVSLGENTIRSFATSALSVIAIVAGALGLPLLQKAREDETP